MNPQSLPTVILGLTVCSYWTCVAIKVLRVSANAGRVGRVLIPERRTERLLWLIWVPLVFAWMILPLIAAFGRSNFVSAPLIPASWLDSGGWTVLRWVASVVAVLALAGSIHCWRHMGARWRMAVDPRQRDHLMADGPFALVRHPIYSLGLVLAACSALILPSLPMLALVLVYAALILLKVREEELFLVDTYGQAYVEYSAATGRFVPRAAALMRALAPGRQTAVAASCAGGHSPAGAAGQPASDSQRLSPFQQAMVLWEQLHPYNAAHAVLLRQAARPAELLAAIQSVCDAAGIGALSVDESAARYRYEPSAIPPVEYIECAEPAAECLCSLLTDELNKPFGHAPQHPIRWIILENRLEQSHYVVAAYRHVAADGRSIELLLSRMLAAYAGAAAAGPNLTWRGFDYDRMMPPLRRAGLAIATSFRTAALYFRFRFMHKMPDERGAGDETRVSLRSVPPDLVERLVQACQKVGVGRNDSFAAALTAGIAALTPDRHDSRHRRSLSLATSLDARSVADEAELSNWFGNCVGDMLLMIARPDGSMREVVAQVSNQTRWQKQRRAAALAISGARLFFVRCVWPLFHVPHDRRSYRKLFPVCGGVSTVAVGVPRFAALGGAIAEYWRACPPGPAMPIVLAPTIFGSRLTLALTYRTSCLNSEQAQALLDHICTRLDEFAAAATPAETAATSAALPPAVSAGARGAGLA